MIQNHTKNITVIIGKNGSGKSTYLRKIDEQLQANKDYKVRYITPERGGSLNYDPGIDNNLSNAQNWLEETRRVNRYDQFRQQSAAQYRKLELFMLRTIEKNKDKRLDENYTFDQVVDKINTLLPIVKMARSSNTFKTFHKTTGKPVPIESLSSGESELIALAIEILVFAYEDFPGQRVLLLDEPDVHLHPDLQTRFGSFIEEVASQYRIKVILATHSTAFTSSFANRGNVEIQVMRDGGVIQSKFSIDGISTEIIPIFGIHPLSQVFNNSPIVLLEGEDDKRVVDQMVRTANGRLKFTPCDVGGIGELPKWEKWVNDVLPSIYDVPRAFSLRDLDDSSQTEIDDLGIVKRVRLNCRAIENIILCDEVLNECGISQSDYLARLNAFKDNNNAHKFSGDVGELVAKFQNRRTISIKRIRNICIGLLEIEKPWEVVVGQLLGKIDKRTGTATENSIYKYLGDKFCAEILRI